MNGQDLVDALQQHVLATMAGMEVCQPGQRGAGYREIEQLAGLELFLPKYDGYLTWVVLMRLAIDGKVEATPESLRANRRKYRLPG